jgi:hypothetical protein
LLVSGELRGRPRVAYGCTIASPDDDDAKKVWLGRILGYSACRTRRGCWHIELCCQRNATTAIAAEVCMPSQDMILGVAEMFDGLPLEDVVTERGVQQGQISFLEIHLPMVAKKTDEHERSQIRDRILAP